MGTGYWPSSPMKLVLQELSAFVKQLRCCCQLCKDCIVELTENEVESTKNLVESSLKSPSLFELSQAIRLSLVASLVPNPGCHKLS